MASGDIMSRCPQCQEMVKEGSNHQCSRGPDRNPHRNPWEEKNR